MAKRIRGQINNRKELCGGTAFFNIDIWRTLTSSNLEIEHKGRGMDFVISLPIDELLEYIKENSNDR